MREAHVLYVRHELFRDFTVCMVGFFIILIRPHPACQMHFIHRVRSIKCIVFLPVPHPLSIIPLELKVPGDGCCFGLQFPEMRVGITLVKQCALISYDMVFVHHASAKVRNEALPDAAVIQSDKQRMGDLAPVIEVSAYGDGCGIRYPNGKVCSWGIQYR